MADSEKTPLTISVFYGSVREARTGIKLARFVVNQLTNRGHKVYLLDAQELNLPLLPKMWKEYKGKEETAPKNLAETAKKMEESDAFVVLCGEYNHSLPPALTNMMDYFRDEYLHKPSGIVSYSGGPWGGVRAAMQARCFLGEIGTVTIPPTLPVAQVWKNVDEKGNDVTEDKNIESRSVGFFNELEWFSHALKTKRQGN